MGITDETPDLAPDIPDTPEAPSAPEYVDLFGETTDYAVLEDELNEFQGITSEEFDALPSSAKRALAVARKQILTKKQEDEARVAELRRAREAAQRSKEEELQARSLIAQFLNRDTFKKYYEEQPETKEPEWNDPEYIKYHSQLAANEAVKEFLEMMFKNTNAMNEAHEKQVAERTRREKLSSLENMFDERGYVRGSAERKQLADAMKKAKAAGVPTTDLKQWMDYAMYTLGWERPAPPPPPKPEIDEDDPDFDIWEGVEGDVARWERMEEDPEYRERVLRRRDARR